MLLDNHLECIGDCEVFEDMELFEVLMKIKRLIILHKFKAALKLILYGRETFKTEALFRYVMYLTIKLKYVFDI